MESKPPTSAGHSHDPSASSNASSSASTASDSGFDLGNQYVVRKNAHEMTDDEIDRFCTAWMLIVRDGKLGSISEGHMDHHNQKNHGAQANGDLSATLRGYPGNQRFLVWHRGYLLVLEDVMRKALYTHLKSQGKDPLDAAKLFIPYWDASHRRDLPSWIEKCSPNHKPSLVLATHHQPEIQSEAHASYGVELGGTYIVTTNRWVGSDLQKDPPTPDHFAAIMKKHDFLSFTNHIEFLPTVSFTSSSEADRLSKIISRNPITSRRLTAMVEGIRNGNSNDQCSELALARRYLFQAKRQPSFLPGLSNEEYQDLQNSWVHFYKDSPHLMMHFYVGGEDPENPGLYGSCIYFQEVAVDPMFWLLHCELDRIWYTWQATNASIPNLYGDFRLIKPWPGGKSWDYQTLCYRDHLPYCYDFNYEP